MEVPVALRRIAEAQLAAVGLRDLQAVRQAGALLLDVGDVARWAARLPAREGIVPGTVANAWTAFCVSFGR